MSILGTSAARLTAWSLLALTLLSPTAASANDEERAIAIVTATCAACHGMDGNSTVPTFPKLAARHPEYIVRELNEFISGKRKSDIMAPIAATLDASDFKLLGTYFGKQKPTSGQSTDPKGAEEGRKLYFEGNEQTGVPACEGCHGTKAEGNSKFPRLAGQHSEYLVKQIYDFRTNVRNTTRIMREVSVRMTDAEIKAVVEYVNTL